jgi:predicted metal-dependent hydrolase
MSHERRALSQPLETSVPDEILRAEIKDWAKRIGVKLGTIAVRKMKTKWASCSSKGNLTFDIELLRQPAAFRRKAIVHELLHFKYTNHGRMFRVMERIYLGKRDHAVTY